MLDDIQPVVRTTIMTILSALYESGMVEEVDMIVVLRLFGITDEDAPIISFRDPGWIDSYIDFREQQLAELAELEGAADSDSNELEEYTLDPANETNKKLH